MKNKLNLLLSAVAVLGALALPSLAANQKPVAQQECCATGESCCAVQEACCDPLAGSNSASNTSGQSAQQTASANDCCPTGACCLVQAACCG